MSALLKAWREATIIVLVALLGIATYGLHLAKGQRQDAVGHAIDLQARHDDAVSRELSLAAQFADKTQELRDWIEGSSERELEMVQECIKVQTELNAYMDHFGPLPPKIVGRGHP